MGHTQKQRHATSNRMVTWWILWTAVCLHEAFTIAMQLDRNVPGAKEAIDKGEVNIARQEVGGKGLPSSSSQE